MNFLHILRKFNFIFLAFSLTTLPGSTLSNPHFQEFGQTYISTYLPGPYKYAQRYNSIVQDSEGFVYIGSEKGVIRFDGSAWKFIAADETSVLVTGGTRIYLKGRRSISLLERHPAGEPVFRIVIGPEQIQGDIINIIPMDDGEYVLTSRGLYHRGETLGKIGLSFIPESIFADGETIVFYSRSHGLQRLENNRPVSWIPSYEIPLENVTDLYSTGEQYILVDGRQNSLSVFCKGVTNPGFGEMGEILKTNGFTCMKELRDGCLAWGTREGGVFITDDQGLVLFRIDRESGLYDNTVEGLIADDCNNLWILHEHAVSRAEIPSAFTYFNGSGGLGGNIRDLVRYDGMLHAAGNEGLFRLTDGHQFERIRGLPHDCRQLVKAGNSLLVGTPSGVYELQGNLTSLLLRENVNYISYNPGSRILLVAAGKDLRAFRGPFTTGSYLIAGPGTPLKEVLMAQDSVIWLLGTDGEVYRSTHPYRYGSTAAFMKVDTEELGSSIHLSRKLFLFYGEVRLACNGIFYWNPENGKFLPDPLVSCKGLDRQTCINEIVQDGPGDLWIAAIDPVSGRNSIFRIQKGPDAYRLPVRIPFRRMERLIVNRIFPETEELTWFCTSNGIIRYSRSTQPAEAPGFKAHISSVVLAGDSILSYDYIESEEFIDGLRKGYLQIPHSSSRLQLRFLSTDYNSVRHPLFQYMLTHIQEDWSDWSENGFTEFSGLSSGKYTFSVRSQDDFGSVSEPDTFRFRILPPFYSSYWAMIIYGILALLLLYAFQKWRTFQHVRERYKLEKIIEERTEALMEEKEKTESLLANILPKKTAEELKSKGKATSSKFKMVTVLFADIQGFTKIAEQMNPDMLIDELDRFYFQFDSVVEKYNIEKIKTIGDAYMAAGGIPIKNRTNPLEVVLAALEMQQYMHELKKTKTDIWDLRIGMHTGSVIAGVVGQKKFSYDIWGDSVNTASRMESSGEVGKVNISATTYQLVKDFFDCEYRGKMPVKYKGDIEMYFVKGLKEAYARDDRHSPNEEFLTQIQLLRLLDMEEYVYQRLEMELPENLYFHNVTHTAHVYTQVELIGRGEKVTQEELLLLRSAALLHDMGYIDKFDGHEEKSVEYAREILPMYRFSNDHIERICKLILSTRIPFEPENPLEKIIIDANLDHLGRVDFLIQSDKLFQEYRMQGKVKTKKDWNNHQINFLMKHDYHTDIARKMREMSREQQIDNIRQYS